MATEMQQEKNGGEMIKVGVWRRLLIENMNCGKLEK